MRNWSREDSRDLARVMIANNPLAQAREKATLERLLECDDRLLGISSGEIKVNPKDYETKIDYKDVRYIKKEEDYRRWVMGRLLDCKKFEKKWDKILMKEHSPALARHKTKWLEEQYKKLYKSDPKKQFEIVNR